MFTGIIENLGVVKELKSEKGNLRITVLSSIASELKIDQSVAHNGVCLTVVDVDSNKYVVVAIAETLEKSNLGSLAIGDIINIERAMRLGDRLDGHMVQGHVDNVGICTSKVENNGSWIFTFSHDGSHDNVTVEKGSITVNGVSLTVINSKRNSFSVAIIPYTYEHTNFRTLKVNDKVNLEFDVIGKYVSRLLELRN